MELFLRSLRGSRRAIVILAGWSIIEALPTFLSGRLIGLAVDRGFVAGAPWTGVGWLLVFAALTVLGAAMSRQVYLGLGRIVEPMRDVLVSAITHGVLRRGATARQSVDASVVARMTGHVEIVRDVTAGLLVYARSFVVTTIAAVAGLLSTAPELAIMVVGPLAVALVVFALSLRSLAARQRAAVLADEYCARAGGLVFSGIRDVLACRAERSAIADVDKEIDGQAKATVRLAMSAATRSLCLTLGAVVPLILVLAAAPGLVHSGRLGPGVIVGAITYLTTGVQPALRALIQTVGSSALRLVVTLGRIADVANTPHRADRGTRSPAGHEVRLRGVEFAWGPHAEPVLRDLDLVIPEGGHLAVVGPSGIGKSTLASLITGLITANRGTITIGGTPVPDIAAGWLRQRVALIPQESYVFTGTLRDNLALYKPGATDAQLSAAAEAIGADGLVRRLGGLDAAIGHDGSTLSTGETQLIALARVYASDATLVILDEATCHLDPAAEEIVEDAFASRPGTLIIIAHRLSSALRANQVLLLTGTGPAPHGSHDELLAAAPGYADLMRAWTYLHPADISCAQTAATGKLWPSNTVVSPSTM